jgi:SAM-dependent methyltransferase
MSRRSKRALQRQLEYQEGVARQLRERGDVPPGPRHAKSIAVRELLSHVELSEPCRILEVGPGGKGLLFYLPSKGLRIGVDPLALDYRFMFPRWTRRMQTCAAFGEQLPFPDEVFDLVLCDNVIDHAEDPPEIVREVVRVLRPGGALYFSVNVHHPVYLYASVAHGAWNALGIRAEIGPFADHTVHMTPGRVRRMMEALPLKVLLERDGVDTMRGRNALVNRLFFKNARYVLIATKTS